MSKKYDAYGLPWGGKIGKDVKDCKTSEEVIKIGWTCTGVLLAFGEYL